MTLKQTIEKIDLLQYLVGKPVPKWNCPILEMIPAPTNDKFSNYMKAYQKTGSLENAMQKIKLRQFDILLIFSKGKEPFSFVYEWYSFFYQDKKELIEKIFPFDNISERKKKSLTAA
jgi:hypothetical protein